MWVPTATPRHESQYGILQAKPFFSPSFAFKTFLLTPAARSIGIPGNWANGRKFAPSLHFLAQAVVRVNGSRLFSAGLRLKAVAFNLQYAKTSYIIQTQNTGTARTLNQL
jgi:hypothetical protein